MPTVEGDRESSRNPSREQRANLTAVARGPWFPLASVLGVIVLIVIVLWRGGSIGTLAAVLAGLGAALGGLAAVLAAMNHRDDGSPSA